MPAVACRKRTVLPLPGPFHGDLARMRNRRGVSHQVLKPEDLLPVDPVRPEKIKLDNDQVLEVGGLHILGSAEDDLMRLFGSERIANVMEMNNFEARKRLLDYDDVMNQQREVVYDMRLFALEGGEDLKGEIWEMIEAAARQAMDEYMPEGQPPEKWDLAGLRRRILLDQFVVVSELPETNDPDHEYERDDIERWVIEGLRTAFHRKIESLGPHAEPVMGFIMLSVIDDKWKDHLYDLDHLKASISFRGWGQKDPLVEYKQEAYTMFVSLMGDLRRSVAQYFFRAQVGVPQQQRRPQPQRLQYSGPEDALGAQLARAAEMRRPLQRQEAPEPAQPEQKDEFGMARSARSAPRVAVGGVGGLPSAAPDPRTLVTNRGEKAGPKKPMHAANEPGRNDPCPCGSGKKYKKCCGR